MNRGSTYDGNLTDSGVSVASWPWSETGTNGTPKGIHPTKCCDFRRFPWYLAIIPMELSLGLYLFTIYFSMQLYQQYAFQRIATDYALNTNITNKCWTQALIENLTSEANFTTSEANFTITNVQLATNQINTISLLSFFLPSSLMVLVVGPLSDAFGRKPFIVLTLVGQAVSSALSLTIVYFELNLKVFIASEFASGIFGGTGAMLALSFSYASDVTPKRWLTACIGLLNAAIFVATTISSSTSYRWIDHTHCNFLPPSLLVLGVAVLAVLFTLFIPESLPRQMRTKQLNSNRKRIIKHIFTGLKIFFWPWQIGYDTFWRLWVLALVMCIAVINDIGVTQIISYFLHNEPFSWSYSLIGIFESIASLAHGLCLIALLPIMVVAKFSDVFIGLVGILFSLGCDIFVALLKSTWEMFLVGALNGVGAVIAPIARSMMSKLVPAHEQGAAFSILSFLELVASCISTVTYNYVYHPGTTSDDNQGIGKSKHSFWLMALLWIIAIPLLMMLLPCCTCRRRAHRKLPTTTTTGEQREHLLTVTNSGSSSDSSLDDF